MKVHKILALTLAMALSICAIPTTIAEAKGETWTIPGDNTYHLDGTAVVIKVEGETLHVTGTGAVPSYDYWSLNERPWRLKGVSVIQIDSTITSIGSYAFANMDKVNRIIMGTSTFIEDTTTFSKIAYKPIFRISDTGVTTQMIGNIPYTSLDSIAAFAQSNTNGACYIFDTNAKAAAFQTMTNPTIPLVYSAADSNAPWNNVENNGNGNVVTRLCYMAPDNVDHSYIVTGQMRYQGRACYEVYSAFLEDYTFACSLRINVTKSGKEISKTDQTYKYIIDIPKKYQNLGTSYRLIGIGAGQVYIFDDMDSNPATLTYETDMPTMTFGLVYK